jgi:pyrrolidone-carboxylate peptidase
MPMKLLVYAFEPYGRNKQNISQQVLSKLRKREGVRKINLPVKFDSSVLLDAVRKTKPDAILGLGQYPRGKKIRIERLAKNQKKSKTQPLSTITSNVRPTVAVTLKLAPNNNAWISYNAGRYVCNYSIYVLLTNTATKDIPLGFLHIPKNTKLSKATKFVEGIIEEIYAGHK